MKGKRLLILGAAFALGLSACANGATNVKRNPARAVIGTHLAQVTSLVSGNQYVIVGNNNGYALPTEPTLSSGKVAGTAIANVPNDGDGYLWTITSDGDYWYISDGTSYIYHANGGSSGTNLAYGSNTNYKWQLTYSSSTQDHWTFKGVSGSNVNSRGMLVNGTNFGGYALSNESGYKFMNIYEVVSSAATLQSISVSEKSEKTWYAGDNVSPSDLKIVANYSNSSSVVIENGDGVSIVSGNPLVVGSNTIEVSYNDGTTTKTGTVAITALAVISLNSIAVTTVPTKTNYYVGELFNSAGMVVTATFSDASTSDVTSDCVFSPNEALSSDNESITVSYTFKGVTKTTSQLITVNDEAADEATFVGGTDLGQTDGNNTPDYMAKLGYVVEGTNAAFATAQYRVYANSEITFRIVSGEIGKITLTGSDSKNPISNLSLKNGESGSFADGVWTGKAQSVTLTASAQARIDTIVIEKTTNDPLLTVDAESISLKTNESAGKQVVATVYNVDNPAFVWTSADNKVVVEVVSTVNGVQTVKFIPNSETAVNTSVVLTITGTELSATISVSITAPAPGETAETAYTVEQAIDAIEDAEGNVISEVYIKGIVSQVDEYNSKYSSITYWISDDGTTNNQFEVYSGKGINGANFNSISDIEVGASVVVVGGVKKYTPSSGDPIYEFNYNNELVSYKGPSHPANYYVEKGSSFAALTAHENKTETESATATKTVNELATEHEWVASSGSTINGCYKSFSLDANINVSTTGDDNCGSVWGTDAKDWRLYQNKAGNVILTASNGYKLASATFTYSNKNNGVLFLGENTVASGTAVALRASEATFNVGNSGSATDGQVRITSISVTYEKSSLDSLDSVQLRFGASFAEADWNAILNDENLEIEEYGVKLFTSSSSSFASATPVQDAIEAGKTPASVSKAYSTPLEVENGMIKFVSIINIKAESAYGTIFCAAPFVRINGKDYFLDEKQYSVNSLAQELLNNEDYSSLSQDALNVLAGN